MSDVVEGRYAYSAWRAATRGEVCPASEHLPTSLGGVEGHPQPGLYRKRDGGGYIDGKKQPHSWVPVKIYLTDASGAVVHRWSDGLKVRACVGQNQEADPYKIWLWCQKTINGVATLNAITQDEYNYWMQNGRWPDDAPGTEVQPEPVVDVQVVASTVTAVDTVLAGIGHNSAGDPEGYDNLLRLLAQEQSAADAWIGEGKEGAAAATMAKNWADKIGELETRIKAAFEKEKKPHWDMCVAIDSKWRNPKALADALKRKMKATFDAIGRKETARLQAIADAEAKAKSIALEAKHRAEMEALRIAREFAPSIELPTPPPPPVVVAEQVRMTFGSGRKAAPKAPVKVAVITDWKAAAAHYAAATKVRDAVQALANADAKKGIACPGSALQDEVVA